MRGSLNKYRRPSHGDGGDTMKEQESLTRILNAPIIKRSVTIAGHASSVSIEAPFWEAFKKIADEQGLSINKLVTQLDDARAAHNQSTGQNINLSSAIRLLVLDHLQVPNLS